ncbi:larval cuticle protein 9-like [Culicoides brevitarsis]|uniref:larval cuticle protein 9-like n=1 Tax=Culicoides brevitarsis TaxID=469753 RepID=UPI00307B8C6C
MKMGVYKRRSCLSFYYSCKTHSSSNNPPSNKISSIMKFAILFVVMFVGCAIAAPQSDVQLLKFENNVDGDNYNFAYEQSDAQKRDESGTFEAGAEPEKGEMKVVGEYSYQIDGKTVTVTYTADANGYRPKVSIS